MSFIREQNHVNAICKNMEGDKCCSYLGVTGNGWECWKESGLKRQIDYKREKGLMSAKGDNCAGYETEIKKTINQQIKQK